MKNVKVCGLQHSVQAHFWPAFGFLTHGLLLSDGWHGALARSEHIYKALKFSDHAPIPVDYAFQL